MGAANESEGEMQTTPGLEKTPAGAATDSTEKEKQNSKETPKYTESQFQEGVKAAGLKAYSDFLTKVGVKYKPIEEENKTLKSQLSAAQSQIEENKSEVAALNARIDELAKDDPDKRILIAARRKLEEETRRLKAAVADHESNIASHKKDRSEFMADKLVAKYGCDREQLIKLTDGDPERMEGLAQYLPKAEKKPDEKKAETKTEDLDIDSGENTGNASSEANAKTMDEYANNPKVKKRYGVK